MILIHKICLALRGLGKFINVASEIKLYAAILLLKESIFIPLNSAYCKLHVLFFFFLSG